jgi:hypothetical protein
MRDHPRPRLVEDPVLRALRLASRQLQRQQVLM